MKIPKKHFYAVNLALGVAGLMMIYNNMSFAPTDCYSEFAENQQKVVSEFHSCQQNAGTPEKQLACFEAYNSAKPMAQSCE